MDAFNPVYWGSIKCPKWEPPKRRGLPSFGDVGMFCQWYFGYMQDLVSSVERFAMDPAVPRSNDSSCICPAFWKTSDYLNISLRADDEVIGKHK